ncbi:hypothetical protein BGZ67_010237 [Mortierella alpina]|nr:hypothetical protein BGZ67_010237 [Mortierella alpina]
MSDRAWVTYLSNTEYLAGCLVLAYSLREVQSRYPLVAQLKSILAVFRTVKSPTQYLFPDQDLLNEVFFGRWKSIGYGYNALKTLSFCHEPIWYEATTIPTNSTSDNIMPVVNVHYILEKPWDVKDLVKAEQESNRFVELYRWWWQVYDELRQETEASA